MGGFSCQKLQNVFFPTLLGIFDEKYIVKLLDAGALQGISEDEKVIWSKKYNVTMERYLKDSLVNYVGRSLNEFLR